MRRFAELFQPSHTTRIIDVGGYEGNWKLMDAAPNVLLVNLEDEDVRNGRFHKVRGDGRSLAYADASFDIAYSNSVIEHVGGIEAQRAFADEIRRVARAYYVQTPNKWFPVEPHLIAVALHWLPRRVTRRLVRTLSIWGWVARPDQDEIDTLLASIRLLGRAEMQELFPDSTIIEERFLGLVKSLIAVRVDDVRS